MSKKTKTDSCDLSDFQNSFKIKFATKNEEQDTMLQIIDQNTITFVKGAPGTGKTHIAVSYALQQLFAKKIDRIVFTRPVVEAAGEKLGYLPGDMYEKIDPYMIPTFETLIKLIPPEVIARLTHKNGRDSIVRILPLAYMRGVTFNNSIIVADESQNTTPSQMRMLLTRIGEGSKIIVCGDTRQSDIYQANGLDDAFSLLRDIDGVGFATLTQNAIVRHPIIAAIEEKYEQRYAPADKKRV